MTEYTRVSQGHFTSAGVAKAVYLPFQPTSVEMWNYSSFATPANHGIPSAYWDSSMGAGIAIAQLFNSTPVLTTGAVTTGGISTFSAGTALQFGSNQTIGASGSITAGSPTVVVTTAAHGLVSGDWVVFNNLYQTTTTGMQQISGIPFLVTYVSTTSFSVNWDSSGSGFTTITGSGTTLPSYAGFKKILYPTLYIPGDIAISAINTTTNIVTTTAPHNFVVGQEVAFSIPNAYGSIELNNLPDVVTPGSPLYYYVSVVGSSTTFTIGNAPSSISAFVPNQPFANFSGLQFPQVRAVGDVNSGGYPYAGSALYPSPTIYIGGSTSQASTINGPAIQGAFINNTRQGFIIGAGATSNDASSVLVGANGNVIYWRAIYKDI